MAINRYALVTRHNPRLEDFCPSSPLSVGNGELAFTADITGMQTFPEIYKEHIPLCTQSQWGWHTFPADNDRGSYDIHDLQLQAFDTYGREVGYATKSRGQEKIYHWLRTNPHRLHLGQIGLDMTWPDGRRVEQGEIRDICQTLDLWTGVLKSRFSVGGIPVIVSTCCHPDLDILAFSIESTLLEEGRLRLSLTFPYGSPDKSAADWSRDHLHNTEIIHMDDGRVTLSRVLDRDRYAVALAYSSSARLERTGRNAFSLIPGRDSSLFSFSSLFSSQPLDISLPSFEETLHASRIHWKAFWEEGGAIELAESRDSRALELERRIVLSQYLTAIQCAGSLPPQETGLSCNSWYGKFHHEMHWWHAAHFPLWGRVSLLERSMGWYQSILPQARALAESQGYRGIRWPKMTGPDGIDSPSPIGPLIIWQQPHPISLAELCYRAHPDQATLEKYRDIVFETAEFMASYAVYIPEDDRYVLGPPVIPAQENHLPQSTVNPAFELEYWHFGLKTANRWRERLGLARNPEWERVSANLAKLPVKNGLYLAHENCPDTFEKYNFDHPSMLGALGILPGSKVDREIMENTLRAVFSQWQFEKMWGWDFPMMAMTAARLGLPQLAVDALLMDSPKNTYLPNGHNKQADRKDLPLYLPGNGGLLTAVAMMAAGWDGCDLGDTPGFPKDGNWKVNWEGLQPMP
ncbi:MAG: glycoside hydrolase family 65 [Clostridia bacterium]|jgi:hypothetical protein